MVINKNFSIESIEILCFTSCFFSLKFVGIVFVSSSYDSITSSYVIAELSIIRAKYFPFSQLHVAGFQA